MEGLIDDYQNAYSNRMTTIFDPSPYVLAVISGPLPALIMLSMLYAIGWLLDVTVERNAAALWIKTLAGGIPWLT
jgi:hypothetical protein